MNFKKVFTSELKPADYNPRKKLQPKDPEYQRIKKSIEEFGYVDPIIVNSDYTVIGGHQRLSVLKEMGHAQIDVVVVDLPKTKEKALNVALNKITGDWDMQQLSIVLSELKEEDFDINITGFSDKELKEIDEELFGKQPKEDNYEPPPEIKTEIKRGDIIALGRHRVMCGDATKKEDITNLTSAASVGLLLTDPPYGISVVGGGGATKFGKVGGGGWVNSNTYPVIEGDESTDTCKKVLSLVSVGNQIIFGGNYFTDFLPPSRCWIVWDKENTGNFADAELAWTSFGKGIKLYHWLWNGLSRKGDRETEGKKRCHPTQKPVGLFCEILNDFSKQGEIVLDPFLGSGTTLIACEQLDRICYGMEISPQYCEVICQRWEKYTGKLRVKA